MKTEILADFQSCISAPLSYAIYQVQIIYTALDFYDIVFNFRFNLFLDEVSKGKLLVFIGINANNFPLLTLSKIRHQPNIRSFSSLLKFSKSDVLLRCMLTQIKTI